jgi:DNA-binding NarL/FixJ family response regulator
VSRRETEVARFVTGGVSNKDVGARLFICERTVESHVRSILIKLGFTSRTQIATWLAAVDGRAGETG